jgi:nucleoid DNA-binding protein
MMYELLYKFLVKYKTIDLPGVGKFTLTVQPAQSRFVDQSFLPPKYHIAFVPDRILADVGAEDEAVGTQKRIAPSRKVFSWIAVNYDLTEREAVARFNDFLFELREQLDAGKKIIWSGIGTLEKGPGSELKFSGDNNQLPWLRQTVAKKVIRENAEHTMLVGETEKTSAQMSEILLNPKSVKDKRAYWWVWPLAVIIAIFIFLGWYFSEHGISGNATGNNQRISSH